jgi:hypothetical protein
MFTKEPGRGLRGPRWSATSRTLTEGITGWLKGPHNVKADLVEVQRWMTCDT